MRSPELPVRDEHAMPLGHQRAFRFLVATVLAVCMPLVLGKLGLASGLYGGLIAVGFDSDRAQLLEYTGLTFVGALVAGIAVRWRSPIWLGTLLYYTARYLIPYFIQHLVPPLAPAGTQQVLVPSTFAAIIATIFSVGLVFSGVGAVMGDVCGRLLVDAFAITKRLILSRHARHRPDAVDARDIVTALSAPLLSLILVGAVFLITSNLGTMLNYGTVATIYQPVKLAELQGTVEQSAYPSNALGGVWRQYMMYLPPSYASSPGRRYPVIYLLHGTPGRITNWYGGAHIDETANSLITEGKMREAIFVAPDGNGSVYAYSQWANSFDNRQRMEDSIVDDLVPYIDKHYRTLADPAHRAIAGLSDGGYGAVNIALHHPNVFGMAVSLSGFFQAANSPVFGVGAAGAAYRSYNSPSDYVMTPAGVHAARSLSFVICVGTLDPTYYPQGTTFYRELKRLGVRADLLPASGGHSWQLWALQTAQFLPLAEPATAAVLPTWTTR